MISRLSTWWQMLTSNPLNFLITAVLFGVALLLSLILHEISHGYVALKCGDPTAKMMGRLTLDPRKHLDPIGLICMMLLGIGWAKPVPINPYNFRKRSRDIILVSVAGIVTNLILFLIACFVYTWLWVKAPLAAGMSLMGYAQTFVIYLMQFNICLAIFNLLPVPPLDGFRLVNQIFFKGQLQINSRMMIYIRYGFLLVCLTGVLGNAFSKVCSFCINGMLNLFVRIWI